MPQPIILPAQQQQNPFLDMLTWAAKMAVTQGFREREMAMQTEAAKALKTQAETVELVKAGFTTQAPPGPQEAAGVATPAVTGAGEVQQQPTVEQPAIPGGMIGKGAPAFWAPKMKVNIIDVGGDKFAAFGTGQNMHLQHLGAKKDYLTYTIPKDGPRLPGTEGLEPGTVTKIDRSTNELTILNKPEEKRLYETSKGFLPASQAQGQMPYRAPSEATADQKDFQQAKTDGFPGNFNDWHNINRSIMSAQSDPRVKDPYSGTGIVDVLPEYMQYYGVNAKAFGWYKNRPLPSEKPAMSNEQLSQSLKGRVAGKYEMGGMIVSWDGKTVTSAYKKMPILGGE